jgi:hypothetical protein
MLSSYLTQENSMPNKPIAVAAVAVALLLAAVE